MTEKQLRSFDGASGPGVMAGVLLVDGEDYLEIDEQGRLVIPPGVKPTGFHLLVAVEDGGRTFVVQKDVGTTGGGYESRALSELAGFAPGLRATVLRDQIEIIKVGSSVWTGWHKSQASNRVDCWTLELDGKLSLFQVGIVTHDNGATFVLHGEYRWRGQLYRQGEGLVAKPEHSKWGTLEGGTSRRTQIFQHPAFSSLFWADTVLPEWSGNSAELDLVLPEVPAGKFGVVDWYVFFAGQTGQGIVKLQGGKPCWVHGVDIEGFDPASSEPPLWRGDIISFEEAVANWGAKPNSPPKLTGVKLVKRAW